MPYPQRTQSKTLSELASIVGGQVIGDGTIRIQSLALAEQAGDNDLAIATDSASVALLESSDAPAALVAAVPQPLQLKGYLVVERPRLAMAHLLQVFERTPHAADGVHPLACIDDTARLAGQVSVGAFSFVGRNSSIGNGSVVLPHVTIGADVCIGKDCLIHSGVRIGDRVTIGNRVILQPNACLGGDGFSYVTPTMGSIESARRDGAVTAQNDTIVRVNSIGTVVLEDDVEIGVSSAVDRATLGATTVRRGTKIDNLVQIGHNCIIGENCLIAGHSGISGSVVIGDRVVLGGAVGIADHVRVGDDAIVTANSGVTKNVSPRSVWGGFPARPWKRTVADWANQRRMARSVAVLRKRLVALEQRLANDGT